MNYSILKNLRSGLEKRIHQCEPRAVLDTNDFHWTKQLEASYPEIRREAEAILKRLTEIINFDSVLPGQRALYQKDNWKSFFIKSLSKEVPNHARMCPETAKALKRIPGLINAFYSIHTPGLHIPPHRGPYAGILRYHMGLIVPEGDIAIKVNGEVCKWQEGRGMIFDDSFIHEAWNHTTENRVILFLDFERPLPMYLTYFNKILLSAFKYSSIARTANNQVFTNQIKD